MREQAVQYAMRVIQRSKDHQEVEREIVNNDKFGPWIEAEFGDDNIAPVQAIVSEAEERLGNKMPGDYS